MLISDGTFAAWRIDTRDTSWLARADELKGDRTSALETYRQLWRHYPDDKSLKTENR
jgi:hypothetical protein